MTTRARQFLMLAGLFGAGGVALGAFCAHALAGVFSAEPARQATYETAVLYHLVHAAALAGAAFAVEAAPNRWTRSSGVLLALGIVLFSGSLYLLSVFGLRLMGAVAPLGGAALIAGWGALMVGAWRGNR